MISDRIIYVYTPDGKTLLQTYKDVVSLTREGDIIKLEIRDKNKNTFVTFSSLFPYYEVIPRLALFNEMSFKMQACVASRFLDKFLNELVLLDIIHKNGPVYSCDIIGMPRIRGKAKLYDWFASKYDDRSDKDELTDIFDKLYEKYYKIINNTNNAISSYY